MRRRTWEQCGTSLPDAAHCVERRGNNAVESDHVRVNGRVRAMQGLKRIAIAAVVVTDHTFVQNLRRGQYFVGGKQVPEPLRVKRTFGELAAAA